MERVGGDAALDFDPGVSPTKVTYGVQNGLGVTPLDKNRIPNRGGNLQLLTGGGRGGGFDSAKADAELANPLGRGGIQRLKLPTAQAQHLARGVERIHPLAIRGDEGRMIG